MMIEIDPNEAGPDAVLMMCDYRDEGGLADLYQAIEVFKYTIYQYYKDNPLMPQDIDAAALKMFVEVAHAVGVNKEDIQTVMSTRIHQHGVNKSTGPS